MSVPGIDHPEGAHKVRSVLGGHRIVSATPGGEMGEVQMKSSFSGENPSEGDHRCQSVQIVSASQQPETSPGGGEPEKKQMALIERTRKAFIGATTAKKYKSALRLAGRLRGHDQLVILDALFAAAKRLGVERSTGEPLGMRQQLDGSVIVTWATTTRRPDGTEVKAVSTAQIEPADEGCGWVGTEEVPEMVVDAVTAAAMSDQLKAPRHPKSGRRIYVR